MSRRVALETQGKVAVADIVGALVDGGAVSLRVDARSGDSGAGVEQYYFFEFDDAADGNRHRVGFAFHAFRSSESERGWTRFELGADDRGQALVESLANRVGGWFVDGRTNSTRVFDAPGRDYVPAMLAA